jgi:hypothetical protein
VKLADTPNQPLELLERDIAARLRPVCGQMSPESFQELVSDIARVKMKYDPQSLPTEQPHRSTADVILPASTATQEDESGTDPR